MPDPFADALDALFQAPGSEDAIYTPEGGTAQPIRVIRSRPDQVSRFGEGQLIQATNLFEIRVSDVAELEVGAALVIADGEFELQGDAQIDVEGLTWSVGAEPA